MANQLLMALQQSIVADSLGYEELIVVLPLPRYGRAPPRIDLTRVLATGGWRTGPQGLPD